MRGGGEGAGGEEVGGDEGAGVASEERSGILVVVSWTRSEGKEHDGGSETATTRSGASTFTCTVRDETDQRLLLQST